LLNCLIIKYLKRNRNGNKTLVKIFINDKYYENKKVDDNFFNECPNNKRILKSLQNK